MQAGCKSSAKRCPEGRVTKSPPKKGKSKDVEGFMTKFRTDAEAPALTQAARTCRNFSVWQAQVAVVTGMGLDFDPVIPSLRRKSFSTG